MLNDAASNKNYGGERAQKLLSSKYGIATSDLQKLKDTRRCRPATPPARWAASTVPSPGHHHRAEVQHGARRHHEDDRPGWPLGAAHGFSGAMGAVGGRSAGSSARPSGCCPGSAGLPAGITATAGGGITAGGTTAGGSNGASPGSTTGSTSKPSQRPSRTRRASSASPTSGAATTRRSASTAPGWSSGPTARRASSCRAPARSSGRPCRTAACPLDKVRAGDIVFSAGSDGTATSPGHEALMISNKQIIEAPYTGADIRIRSYNPGEWQHAGRPTGSMTNVRRAAAEATAAASRRASRRQQRDRIIDRPGPAATAASGWPRAPTAAPTSWPTPRSALLGGGL